MEQHGKPIVAMIDFDRYQRLTTKRERLFNVLDRVWTKNRTKSARLAYRDSTQTVNLINLIKDTALLITDPGVVSAQLRDPDDLAVLACALAGDAEYIVTGDHDLLDLHSFEGVQIVRPSLFLQLLHSLS